MKAVTGLAALTLATVVPAADLKVGDAAPKFEAIDDQGNEWASTDYFGKGAVVVYFYPADMTPGCTKQACGFRDDMNKLKDRGVRVIGVSGDSARNHQLFKEVYNLNYTLLADEEGAVAKAFGVPTRGGGSVKKDVNGKLETFVRGVTASRWTFVIDAEGKIVDKLTKVKAAQDSQRILKLLGQGGVEAK